MTSVSWILFSHFRFDRNCVATFHRCFTIFFQCKQGKIVCDIFGSQSHAFCMHITMPPSEFASSWQRQTVAKFTHDFVYMQVLDVFAFAQPECCLLISVFHLHKFIWKMEFMRRSREREKSREIQHNENWFVNYFCIFRFTCTRRQDKSRGFEYTFLIAKFARNCRCMKLNPISRNYNARKAFTLLNRII